jgi:hypothetical protein
VVAPTAAVLYADEAPELTRRLVTASRTFLEQQYVGTRALRRLPKVYMRLTPLPISLSLSVFSVC